MGRPWMVALLVLGACDKPTPRGDHDADGDGLSDEEEDDLGLDPSSDDSDGDGLSDAAELDAGSDPLDPDSDDDSLVDGEEWSLGTDPTAADSDGDTYLDPWEVTEGTDPVDAESRIYTGYWPYNPDKAALTDPGFDGSTWETDEFVPDFRGNDQYDDRVSLFDLLGHDKDVVVYVTPKDFPIGWAAAEWISTHGQEDVYNYEAQYADARTAIDDGDLLWVTALTEDEDWSAPTSEDAADWDEKFPHERIPVLSDGNQQLLDAVYYETGFYPSAVLLNPKGKILEIGGLDQVLGLAQSRLAD